MNAISKVGGQLLEVDEFFAPAPHTIIHGLFGQYQELLARIDNICSLVTPGWLSAAHYFRHGNKHPSSHLAPMMDELFKRDGAVRALNADYWQRALNLTNVYKFMPVKRRDEWDQAISNMTTPDFTEENVVATLDDLLASRPRFLAERVDGVFQGLSRTHVTNAPEGFRKRMIVNDAYNVGYCIHTTSKAQLFNDLRSVVAMFMGRGELPYGSSDTIMRLARQNHGQWHAVDGGALRIRAYLKGTMHIEVHEDMAWRLNAILHTLYPRAIPSRFRVKPKTKPRQVANPIQQPLPVAVVDLLGRIYWRDDCAFVLSSEQNPAAVDMAKKVLAYIGGAKQPAGSFAFDYIPSTVINEIVCSGCVPEKVSHQYYPTPDDLAAAAVQSLEDVEGARWLEPSAGQGAIASHMPNGRTQCVEISRVHCLVLESKGLPVDQADFLVWAEQAKAQGRTFDRIVMNPPYWHGQYMPHIEAAVGLLAEGGQIAAIVPASQRNTTLIEGLTNQAWSPVHANRFGGTSMDVTIWTGRKASSSARQP